jgi:hypothetical protein
MERRHFFISRAGEDEQSSRFLAQELSVAGYSYYEQDQWRAGDDFVREMGAAIDACEYTLGLFTPDYWEKQYTSAEWRAAWSQQKLIGVMVAPCRVDTMLQTQIFIDLTKAGTRQEKADVFLLEIGKRTYSLPVYEGGWSPPLQSRRVRRKPAADLLPYLCDREKQEPAMLESLAAFDGKPVVFVVGAEDEHRPEKVRERLANVTIHSHFGGRAPLVQPKFIAWPSTLDRKEFRQALERAKKENGLGGIAPEDVIVVGTDVVVEKSSEDVIDDLLREYIHFWRDTSAGQGCLFVVCLSISYRSPGLMRWLHLGRARSVVRDAVERLRGEAKTSGCTVLPPLECVQRQHVHNWAQLTDVQTFATIETEDIEALFDERNVLEIPMKELAPQLRSLIERKAINR